MKGDIYFGTLKATFIKPRKNKENKVLTCLFKEFVFTLNNENKFVLRERIEYKINKEKPRYLRTYTLNKIEVLDKKYLSKTNYDL